MNSFIILFPEIFNNEDLFKAAIDQFPDWVQLIPHHAWQITTNESKSGNVRAKITNQLISINQNTVPFFVFNVTNSGWATHKINTKITDWLKKEH